MTYEVLELLDRVEDDRDPGHDIQEPNRPIQSRKPARLSVLHELDVETEDNGIQTYVWVRL